MGRNRLIVGAVLLFLCFSVSMLSAEENSLAYLTKAGTSVKVFLSNFVNESDQPQIKAEDFKKSFETALLNRKAVKFEIVKDPKESDVQISCAIKKYAYSKTDPINNYSGASSLLLDAVTTENYAEMSVFFMITDTKTNSVVWEKVISDYIERMMTPEESIPLVYDKVSRTFLWRSFGKPKRN